MVAGALHTPSTTLIVWLAGGLYTLLGSICLTELGTMAPQAGGYYVYARRAFGDVVGFAVGWTDWLTYCAVLGYASIGMAEFAGMLTPALAGAVRPVAIVHSDRVRGPAVGGHPREQPLSGDHDRAEVSRVLRAGRRGAGALRPCPAADDDGTAAAGDARRGDCGRPGCRHLLRGMAERALLHRGGSRPEPQPAARDDWRRAGRDRDLHARQHRVARRCCRSRSSRSRRCRPRRPPSGSWVRRVARF